MRGGTSGKMSLVLHYVYHLLLLIHEIVAFFKVTTALRLSQLDMPPTTVVGDTIEMSCLYELDNDSLYAVKWYKNGHEFFRFVPQDSPNGQYLKMDGVKVDVGTTNAMTNAMSGCMETSLISLRSHSHDMY